MASQLQRYFNLRVKNLFNHLHDFELTGGEVPLHDLRVELKKLRALIKFLRTVYPGQKLKRSSQSLRTIFREAGEIREYQVMQQWLNKTILPDMHRVYFPEEKLKNMITVFHDGSASIKKGLKEIIEQCGGFIHSTNHILPEQYMAELHGKIEKMLRRPLPSGDWHEFRKLVKQWMYATGWVKNDEDAKTDFLFSHLNKLQEIMGQWHDLEVIKDCFAQRQIYLSPDIAIQKDFGKAWEKLDHSIKYKEKQVEDMLSKIPVTERV